MIFLTRFLLAVCVLAPCLTPAAVQAGEWVEVYSGDPSIKGVTYQSELMLPGEQVTILSGGIETWSAVLDLDASFQYNALYMNIILQAGNGPFLGYGGVELRNEENGTALLTLEAPAAGMSTIPSLIEDRCGGGAVGFVPALSSFGNLEDTPSACFNACFTSSEDAASGRDPVPCDSGQGTWVQVLIAGSVSEWADDPWISDAVQASDVLIIKALTAESNSFSLTVDATLRDALWGDVVMLGYEGVDTPWDDAATSGYEGTDTSQSDTWRRRVEEFTVNGPEWCGYSPSPPSYDASQWEHDQHNAEARAWGDCLNWTGDDNVDRFNSMADDLNSDGCCTAEIESLLEAKRREVELASDAFARAFDDYNSQIASYNDDVASYSDDYGSYDDSYDSYEDDSYDSYDYGETYEVPPDTWFGILPGMN